MRRFRVSIHIKLGAKLHIAMRRHRPSHHHAPLQLVGQRRIQLKCQGNVGQWSQRHQRIFARLSVHHVQQSQRSVQRFRPACRGQPCAPQSIVAVGMGGTFPRQHQRLGAAGINGNVMLDEIYNDSRVAGGVVQPHVAGHNQQGFDSGVGMRRRRQNCQRIIHAGVGVNN